jgi:hypothetical protein
MFQAIPPLVFFVILQLFDSASTLVGFKLGLGEGNPVVRSILPSMGPIGGILISKTVALALVAACFALGRSTIISKVNRWYVALVLWNFVNISYVMIVHPF